MALVEDDNFNFQTDEEETELEIIDEHYEEELVSPLEKALRDHSNGLPVRKGCEKHNVSISTLMRHKKNPSLGTKRGVSTILMEGEEARLVEWILACASKGAPRGWREIVTSAEVLLNQRVCGGTIKSGREWCKSFYKRHNLAERTPEKLSRSSACVSKRDVCGWFERVHGYMLEKGLMELLHDSSRIYNADESFFLLNQTVKKVVTGRGSKNVYLQVKDDKAGLTVMATFCADGSSCKPFIIYPYIRFPREVEEKFPSEDAFKSGTKNGWMDGETFCVYLQCLAEEAIEKGIKLPEQKILLFIDRHPSHMTIKGCETAKSLGIELICLYPNCTYLLQPADVACFKPLKQYWNEELQKLNPSNIGYSVTKADFANTFLQAFKRLSNSIVKNAFRTCGIYPFDKEAVDYSKCLGKSCRSQDSNVQSDYDSQNFETIDDQHDCQNINNMSSETIYLYPDMLDFDMATKVVENELSGQQKVELLEHVCWSILTPSAEDIPASPSAEDIPASPSAEDIPASPSAEEIPASPSAVASPAFGLVVPPTPARLFKKCSKRTADVITSDEHIESMMIGQMEKENAGILKQARIDAREVQRKAQVSKHKFQCHFCPHALSTQNGINRHEQKMHHPIIPNHALTIVSRKK